MSSTTGARSCSPSHSPHMSLPGAEESTGAMNVPWACLPVRGLVVPHADGLLCLVLMQGAALHGHSSLGTSARPGWQGLRDLPGFL